MVSLHPVPPGAGDRAGGEAGGVPLDGHHHGDVPLPGHQPSSGGQTMVCVPQGNGFKFVKKIYEIVVTNKFFEKYCTTIVIFYMSVPTTYMSLVLSDLYWILSLLKYNLLLLLLLLDIV